MRLVYLFILSILRGKLGLWERKEGEGMGEEGRGCWGRKESTSVKSLQIKGHQLFEDGILTAVIDYIREDRREGPSKASLGIFEICLETELHSGEVHIFGHRFCSLLRLFLGYLGGGVWTDECIVDLLMFQDPLL